MKQVLAAWKWSLIVTVRSYRTLLALAGLVALWAGAAYAWLGLPESSGLLLILALVWAITQALVALDVIAGTACGAANLAATGGRRLPLHVLWARERKKLLNAATISLLSLLVFWLFSAISSWMDLHYLNIASVLTFHSQRPISHVLVGNVYAILTGPVWIGLFGLPLSLLVVAVPGGWRETKAQGKKVLWGYVFRGPFFTSFLCLFVALIAYVLAVTPAVVAPGFWDYAQLIARISGALILAAAVWLFWLLSLARLHTPPAASSPYPETIPALLP